MSERCRICVGLYPKKGNATHVVTFVVDASALTTAGRADHTCPYIPVCRQHAEQVANDLRSKGYVGVAVSAWDDLAAANRAEWYRARSEGISQANKVLAERIHGKRE